MNRSIALGAVAALLAPIAAYCVLDYRRTEKLEAPARHRVGPDGSASLVSGTYHLDRIFRSMEGPHSPHPGIRLSSAPASSDLVWLTGLETEVVDAVTEKRISQEFFCHSNLTLDGAGTTPARIAKRLGREKVHVDWRLFTLVPGRLSIRLPEGFGIPLPADTPLDYFSMSLNQNVADRTIDVRLRTKVRFVPSTAAGAPTRALFRRALYVLDALPKDISMAAPGPQIVMKAHPGAGCGDTFCSVNASAVSAVGKTGEGKTLHWMVPPGRHTYRTEVSPQLNLPFDTTVHYATIHVHPYAKFMEMRDLDTGTTLFRMAASDWEDRIGVAHVDEWKSQEGIQIRQNGRYEVTAEYDNPTNQPIDAMGIIYLYMLEKNWGSELIGGAESGESNLPPS